MNLLKNKHIIFIQHIILLLIFILSTPLLVSCKKSSSSSSSNSGETESSANENDEDEEEEEEEATNESSTSDTNSEEEFETYALSATTSGLEGTLTVKNDGSSITFTADGTSSFSESFESDDTYSVSISSEPVNQNCSLSSSSGTFSSSNITVSITCVSKSWTHSSTISDSISSDATDETDFIHSIDMASDNNGNVIIVWSQTDDSDSTTPCKVFKSEYRNGAWDHPDDTDFINPSGGDCLGTKVAMDENGNALITWYQHDSNGDDQIFLSEYRNDSWDHPDDADDNISPDATSAYNPNVSMDDNGNAIIAWRQEDASSDYQLFISEYRSGSWTHPSSTSDVISPTGTDVKSRPSIGMNNNGTAIISWSQKNSTGNSDVFKSEYRNSTWDHPNDVDDYISTGTNDLSDIKANINDDGVILISWLQRNSSNKKNVYISEYRNSSWTHPTDSDDHISPTSSHVQAMDMDLDDDGNAVIAWSQDNTLTNRLLISEYRNGSWDHPDDINDTVSSVETDQYVNVTMDNNGQAIIFYEGTDSDGTSDALLFSEYRNGSWSHPADNTSWGLRIDSEKFKGNFAVTMNDDGEAWLAFNSGTQSGYDNLFLSIFE